MYLSNPVAYSRYFDLFDCNNAANDHQKQISTNPQTGEEGEVPIKSEFQEFSSFPMYTQPILQPQLQRTQMQYHQGPPPPPPMHQGFGSNGSASNQDFFHFNNNNTVFGTSSQPEMFNPQSGLTSYPTMIAAQQHQVPVLAQFQQPPPPPQQQLQQAPPGQVPQPLHYGQYEYYNVDNKKVFSLHPSTTSFDIPQNAMYLGGSVSSSISSSSKSNYESDPEDRTPQYYPGGKRRYRVIRGMSAGGCATRPPKNAVSGDRLYIPVELDLLNASVEDCCFPQWNANENLDKRRIIRIERIQEGNKLVAKFSIVGAADDNPVTAPAPPDTDVVEVSCLQCVVRSHEDDESQESGDDSPSYSGSRSYSYGSGNGGYRHNSAVDDESAGYKYNYYITSVEVVEIVELLIGTQLRNQAERRKERGRVRSNLVPFWSKKPILSRMSEHNQSSPNSYVADFRAELAKRIMGYDIRKPRGFDKEVRILRWDKLVPALKRALQSYYTEIPHLDSHKFVH